MKMKAVYIAMCTQLKISSLGGVCGEDTQVIFHQSDGRGHDADQLHHAVQTRVQSDAHQVTQQTRKRGKRRGFEGLRGRVGFQKCRLDFFSLPMFDWPGGLKRRQDQPQTTSSGIELMTSI